MTTSRQAIGAAETRRDFAPAMDAQNLRNVNTVNRALENTITKRPEVNIELID